MPPKKQPDFQNKLEEARKRVDELTPIYQRLKEKINPSPKIRKIHEHKVEATLRPTARNAVLASERRTRKIKKTKGDPANLSTWPVVDLKQFMRAHNLKGVSKKKKSELVETIQKYIS
jgi:hypothetical protein